MHDRRVYSAEFKRKAVQEYYATKLTQGAIEKKLGIGAGCLCRWIQELKAPTEAFPGHGNLPASAAEMAALQRRLQVAEEENEILKKSLAACRPEPERRFLMVEQAAQHHTVERSCSALMVSPSGYYAWQKRKESPCQRRQDDIRLIDQIRAVHHTHYGCYGSPRIHAALRAEGEVVSKHRVARLMREASIEGKRTHRRVSTTVADPEAQAAANLLNRNFTARAPNQKWVVDVTYILTAQGWLYLAVVLDLFARKVVGWATSTSFDQELVILALNKHSKPARRRPCTIPTAACSIRASLISNCWPTTGFRRA